MAPHGLPTSELRVATENAQLCPYLPITLPLTHVQKSVNILKLKRSGKIFLERSVDPLLCFLISLRQVSRTMGNLSLVDQWKCIPEKPLKTEAVMGYGSHEVICSTRAYQGKNVEMSFVIQIWSICG